MHLRKSVAAELQRAAASSATEICGALIGTADGVVDAMALPNQSADPNDAFCIAATDVLQLERAGVSLCGFYHSHPRGNAQPSERDLAFAVPGFVYMIVARDGALRAWRLRDARDGFDEIRIDRDDD